MSGTIVGVLAPVQGLLEKLPRDRTAHAVPLRTILAVLAGSPARRLEGPAPLLEELSESELRVVRYLPSNLKAPRNKATAKAPGNYVHAS